MLEKIKQYIVNFYNQHKTLTIAVSVIFLLIIGYLSYQLLNKHKNATYEAQEQAETVQGVQIAADNAHVKILQSQLDEAKNQIAALKNRKPDAVVQTVVKEVPVIIEKERDKAKADFAIITNPKEPNKKVDLGDYKQTDPIVLNQYNVHAYKKVLRGITYYPKQINDWQPQEITVDWSRKITRDGKYVGIAAGYDFEQDKAKIGVRVTF